MTAKKLTTPEPPGQSPDTTPRRYIAHILRPWRLLEAIRKCNTAITTPVENWLAQCATCSGWQCLTCDRTFDNDKTPPLAFFMVERLRDGGPPNDTFVGGFCEDCARAADTPLHTAGLRGVFGEALEKMTVQFFVDDDGHDGEPS